MNLSLLTEEGLLRQYEVPDDNLARTLWLRFVPEAPHLCAGLGRCGLCRVRLEPLTGGLPEPLAIERDILGNQVAAGWRLACRHTVGSVQGCGVRVPGLRSRDLPQNEDGSVPATPPVQTEQPGLSGKQSLFLAVDLGTTSIGWQLLDRDGAVLASGQDLNPQSGAGSDVVSRIAAAATGAGRGMLSGLVRRHLKKLVDQAEQGASGRVVEVCLAANTAMTAIFLDRDIRGLLAAPYSLPEAGGRTARVPGLPPVWIPPQAAPFVGGDLAAGLAWSLSRGEGYPFLFADLGTNAEFALALDEGRSLLASVPLGPALEGTGLSCGGLTGPGSITGFSLSAQGLSPTVLGGGEARSLSGTGALELLDVLFRVGLLGPDGRLAEPTLPLGRRLLRRVERHATGWRILLPGGLSVTAGDVEAVLQVRAAFVVAVDSLLRAAGLEAADLRSMILAGSLGEHAAMDVLENLGFVPSGLAGRARAVGNAALAGAGLFLVQPEWRQRMIDWSKTCVTLALTEQADFMQRFAQAMRLR